MIHFIYVNGVKLWLDQPRDSINQESARSVIRGSQWSKVRLRETPTGPVFSEHSVPSQLFDEHKRSRFFSGGSWYSLLPDEMFVGQPA